MLEPNRISSNIKPEVTVNLDSGYWYYNYDITEIAWGNTAIMNEKDEDVVREDESTYSFVQVRVKGKPEYKKCVELVIREYLTQSQEFDLINSANKDILAGKKSSESIKEYEEYLSLLEEIKTNVAKDLGK